MKRILEAITAAVLVAVLGVTYASATPNQPTKFYFVSSTLTTNVNASTVALADTFTTGNPTAAYCVIRNLDTTAKMCVSLRTSTGGSTALAQWVLLPKASGNSTFSVELNELDTRKLGITGVTHIIYDTDDCDGGGDATVVQQTYCAQNYQSSEPYEGATK